MGTSGRIKDKNRTRPTGSQVAPDSPEGRDIGLSDRTVGVPSPIPGGRRLITQPPAVRQKPAAPVARPPFRGVMAHGVPPETPTRERAHVEHGPNSTRDPVPTYQHREPPIVPVPVYVVADQRGEEELTSTGHKRYIIPAYGSATSDGSPWVRLVGRNTNREHVYLLNEDASNGIRISNRPDVSTTQHSGTLLPAAMSSYLRLSTQDELYAISDTATAATISIIEEFGRPGAAVP